MYPGHKLISLVISGKGLRQPHLYVSVCHHIVIVLNRKDKERAISQRRVHHGAVLLMLGAEIGRMAVLLGNKPHRERLSFEYSGHLVFRDGSLLKRYASLMVEGDSSRKSRGMQTVLNAVV